MELRQRCSRRQQILNEVDVHQQVYWNLIAYFALSHLPYEFMVPYTDRNSANRRLN